MRIIINITERNLKSTKFSLSKEIIAAHAQGLLHEIVVAHDYKVLYNFIGKTQLDKVIGAGMANGRIYPDSSDKSKYYFLAPKHI